ncbi:MAG TPA: hypothetical protein VHZ78_09455 [Rhizomicrobium sp.]|jgi:hypothetical protein|nr:hypothetical protein [Rhizomicrobium sp.]
MTNKTPYRVLQTSTTTGLSAYALAAPAGGQLAFSAFYAFGDVVSYSAFDTNNFEIGSGVLSNVGSGQIARTTILLSSNANAAVNWPAGTRQVAAFVAVGSRPVIDISANRTVDLSDWGNTFIATGTGATLTLPAISGLPQGYSGSIRNAGTGPWTISTSDTIEGASTLTVPAGSWTTYIVNGSVWSVLSAGLAVNGGMDATTISAVADGETLTVNGYDKAVDDGVIHSALQVNGGEKQFATVTIQSHDHSVRSLQFLNPDDQGSLASPTYFDPQGALYTRLFINISGVTSSPSNTERTQILQPTAAGDFMFGVWNDVHTSITARVAPLTSIADGRFFTAVGPGDGSTSASATFLYTLAYDATFGAMLRWKAETTSDAAANYDTNLYRGGTSQLKTDSAFVANSVTSNAIAGTVGTFSTSLAVGGDLIDFATNTMLQARKSVSGGIARVTFQNTAATASGNEMRLGLGANAGAIAAGNDPYVSGYDDGTGTNHSGLKFGVYKAGNALAMTITPDRIVNMAAYGGGLAQFDTSGNLSSSYSVVQNVSAGAATVTFRNGAADANGNASRIGLGPSSGFIGTTFDPYVGSYSLGGVNAGLEFAVYNDAHVTVAARFTATGTTPHLLLNTITDSGNGEVLQVNGAISVNSAILMRTYTTLTNGAGTSTGTLTNAPSAGNPTKWVEINDNGTIRKIPTWT